MCTEIALFVNKNTHKFIFETVKSGKGNYKSNSLGLNDINNN